MTQEDIYRIIARLLATPENIELLAYLIDHNEELDDQEKQARVEAIRDELTKKRSAIQ